MPPEQVTTPTQLPTLRRRQSKIGWISFTFGFVLAVMADIIEIFTAGTIGWFVGIVVDIILLILLGLSRGGRKQFMKILLMVGGETIPGINIIPLRSLILIWAFISSRRQ